MKPESRKDDHPSRDEDRGGYDKLPLLRTGGLAVALGVVAWLLSPFLFPTKVPKDFPELPDLKTVNPALRAFLQSADREARRRPGSAEAIGKLGMAYHANLFVEQAARAYGIAARLAPGDDRWAYAQAYLQEERGNEKEQLSLLRETLRLKPDHPLALLKLADWFFKQDRLDDAAHYYEMAAGVPGNGVLLQATFGLGRVAARRRDWKKVVEYIAPLSRNYPSLLAPFGLLQEAYQALGQTGKAAEAREGASLASGKTMPPPVDPWNGQLMDLCYSTTRLLREAGLQSRFGNPERALLLARRAAQTDPADPDVRAFLATTLLDNYQNKPEAIDEALTQIAECLRLRPDDLAPLWTFTTNFFKAAKPPSAIERLDALLRLHAGSPEAHFSLGLLADAKGETAEALSQYQAALREKPNDYAISNQLGKLLDKIGKYDEAIAQFRRSLQLNPQIAAPRRNLGLALIQQGNYGQGMKEFEELLRLNPHDTETYVCMGFALLNLRRNEEAIPKFREVLRYKPDSPEGHYGLAFAFSEQGRLGEAMPELREALRLRPAFPEALELLHRLER
jgi:tetratricopeptide (TPR) repeat protein